MKFSIEISKERYAELKKLMNACDIKDPAELINNSLTLLEWAVGEEQSGRPIASIDYTKNVSQHLRMPILDIAKEKKFGKPKVKGDHLKLVE